MGRVLRMMDSKPTSGRKRFDIGYASDQGKRASQEDSLGFREYDDGSLLAVIADGMGGHEGGDVASQAAIKVFGEYFPHTTGDIPARLHATLLHTNQKVCAVAQREGLQQMGTTLVAVFVQENALHWVSVGDSLLYQMSDGILLKRNAEHTLRERFRGLLASGKISQAEYAAVTEPQAITSALGISKLHEIDQGSASLPAGSLLILASDGLLTLNQEATGDFAGSSNSAQVVADSLLQGVLAKNRASQDNTSLIVIRHPAVKPTRFRQAVPVIVGLFLLQTALGGVWFLFDHLQEQVSEAQKQAALTQKEASAQLQRMEADLQTKTAESLQAQQQATQKAEEARQEREARRQAESKAKAATRAKAEAERRAASESRVKQEAEQRLQKSPPQSPAAGITPAQPRVLDLPELPPPSAPPNDGTAELQ
jgi:serine/threonine protein phosphatase PrpC